ncbi:membrane cofactor protein-like [Melanotaenia boesemani]|uniref:membrane cofactor protein-like n=1 Tax=Melanotaenia boesemani TaxID=1250792 RepID=UPI001C04D535|nr:membrane cofactor protein-like [Melanotaenia boesemani]
MEGRVVCEGIKCSPPPAIVNGHVDPDEEAYNYRQVVTYVCDNDYTLEGAKQGTCLENHEFSHKPPICKPKDCSRPGGGSYMHLKGNDNRKDTFPHNSTVTFECNEGFNDEGGSPQSTCTAGRWSPVELRCEIKNCGTPKNVTNGHINYERTEYNDKATIRCDHGYKLIGNSEITCKMMGWSEPSTCQVVTCVSPPVVANGSFTPVKDVYRYEDSVVYSCDDGYKLLGSETLKCKNNDTFLPDPPQCKRQDEDKILAEPGLGFLFGYTLLRWSSLASLLVILL